MGAHKIVVLEWLYRADQDFGFARLSLKNTNYYDPVCFFFQQSAEKYLKAYIVKFGLKFEKTHDLPRLLNICRGRDSSLIFLEDACRFLNPFYLETRYADAVFAVRAKNEAEEAFRRAEQIQAAIRKNLGIVKEISPAEIEKENRKVDKTLKGT